MTSALVALSADDLADAAALLEAAGLPGFSEPALAEELARPGTIALGARLEGRWVGVLIAVAILDEAEIHAVAVRPDARRRGLGRALVAAALDAAAARGVARVFLEVRAGNVAAQRLYLGLGAHPLHVRARYYADGEDAVQLAFELHER